MGRGAMPATRGPPERAAPDLDPNRIPVRGKGSWVGKRSTDDRTRREEDSRANDGGERYAPESRRSPAAARPSATGPIGAPGPAPPPRAEPGRADAGAAAAWLGPSGVNGVPLGGGRNAAGGGLGVSSEPGRPSTARPRRDPIDEFVRANGVDERAAADFRDAPAEVQRRVLARGDLSTARNPSAALLVRIKDARAEAGVENCAEIDEFVRANGIDERAAADFRDAPAEVQRRVLARGDLKTARNPSAALLVRIKDARAEAGVEDRRPAPGSKGVTCRYWEKGGCRNGESCPFLHSWAPGAAAGRRAAPPEPLAEEVREQIQQFLEDSGGQLEGGQVAHKFVGVKRVQLEDAFEVVNVGKGKFWVRVPGLEAPLPQESPKVWRHSREPDEWPEEKEEDPDLLEDPDREQARHHRYVETATEEAEAAPPAAAEEAEEVQQPAVEAAEEAADEEEAVMEEGENLELLGGVDEDDALYGGAVEDDALYGGGDGEEVQPPCREEAEADTAAVTAEDDALYEDLDGAAPPEREEAAPPEDPPPGGEEEEEAAQASSWRGEDDGWRPTADAPAGSRSRSRGAARGAAGKGRRRDGKGKEKGAASRRDGGRPPEKRRCRFYATGCRNGSRCPFLHEDSPSQQEANSPWREKERTSRDSAAMLDIRTIDGILHLIRENGGEVDSGKICKDYRGIKRAQLELHFRVRGQENGKFTVSMP